MAKNESYAVSETDASGRDRAGMPQAGAQGRPVVSSYFSMLQEILAQASEGDKVIYQDAVIKELLKDAGFTGFLLSRIVKEMKDVSIEEFCAYTGACRENAFKLKGEAAEYGTSSTKTVRLDFVLEYAQASERLLRINIEPQASQQSYSESRAESYSLVARAVYNACLAMATELQTAEQYHAIRKVYSIWICYKRPVPDVREPVISYSIKPDEDYPYAGGGTVKIPRRKFDDGDLLGVVLLSMPDIEAAVRQGRSTSKFAVETLGELCYLLSGGIARNEREAFMRQKGIIREGVNNMAEALSLEERMMAAAERLVEKQVAEQVEKQVAEQVEKQVAEQVEKQVADSIIEIGREFHLSAPEIVARLGKKLSISEDKALQLYHDRM